MKTILLKKMSLGLIITLFSSCAFSQLLVGRNPNVSTTPIDLVQNLKPKTILILGEMHGMAQIQKQHLVILSEIRKTNFKISIGFEFLNFTDQKIINDYKLGLLTDDEFKAQIKWKGFDFSYYKEQFQFPLAANQENTIGLNVPLSVTRQISKNGFSSLSIEDRSLIPADFVLGNDLYKERFLIAAGSHLPPDKVDNYFAAQSTWDEVMAYQTVQYLKNSTDDLFVIIVGEFHSQYGGGLTDRLKQRLLSAGLNWEVITISQIPTQDLNANDLLKEITPSIKYGHRGDYIWLSK